MAVSRARTALSLLAGIVAGLSAALAASRLQADATITFPLHPLNPNGAEGAGFSGRLGRDVEPDDSPDHWGGPSDQ